MRMSEPPQPCACPNLRNHAHVRTSASGRHILTTDKGCRVLTIEEARLRKRRAEEKLEGDVWKQQCLEEKRQEKAFE